MSLIEDLIRLTQSATGRTPQAQPQRSSVDPLRNRFPVQLGGLSAPGARVSVGDQQRENALLGRVSIPGTDSGWWRPASANTTTPAAERAYQTEKSRVAQLAAQNPELQRYEAARKIAAAQGATPEQVQSAEDIGMQIWAQKYGKTLAPKIKPGQAGYDVIQGTLAGNAARTAQGFNMAEQLVPTPQGFPAQIPAFPSGAGYSTGFGVATNLAPGAQTPPPYSTIKPSSELSGLGAAPLGTAQTSVFGQPNVMDSEQFEKLLKMVSK